MWDLFKRVEEIKRVKKGPSLGTYSLLFRGTLTPFPEYIVSIDLPVYRLSNGRTLARQREYIAKHGLPDDFFSKDPESQAAIDAQDEILGELVNEQELFSYFKNPQTVQNEPIILDENGYIINGNRRICAMRKLLHLDRGIYKKYEYIRVIFLENYGPEDIIKLEAQLQIEKDIKAPYSWITEALLYKGLMEKSKYNFDTMERIYDKKKSEIQLYLDMIADVDEYLLARNLKDQYTKLEKTEFVFRPLNNYRKELRDPQDKEIFKQTVFKILDDPTIAQDRLYRVVKEIHDNFEQVKKCYLDEHPELKAPVQAISVKPKSYGLLEPVHKTEDLQATQSNEKIITFLKDNQKSSTVAVQVVNTLDLCKRAKKEKDSKDAFRIHLQEAHTNLISAKACFNQNSNTNGVLKELENIDDILKDIKGLVK